MNKKSLIEERIQLAKAFGLKIDGLISFKLEVDIHSVPRISTVYRAHDTKDVLAISKKFNLRLIGIGEPVDLPDVGRGIKDVSSLADDVGHFAKG
jgi:hypothetical protein